MSEDNEIGAPVTFEKRTLNTSVGIDIDDQLTWAELFWFVDQARAAGVHPSSAVPIQWQPENPEIIERFTVYVEPGGRQGQ